MMDVHAYHESSAPFPSQAEIEAAMRRARRERAEVAYWLVRRAAAWLARVRAKTVEPGAVRSSRPGRVAATGARAASLSTAR